MSFFTQLTCFFDAVAELEVSAVRGEPLTKHTDSIAEILEAHGFPAASGSTSSSNSSSPVATPTDCVSSPVLAFSSARSSSRSARAGLKSRASSADVSPPPASISLAPLASKKRKLSEATLTAPPKRSRASLEQLATAVKSVEGLTDETWKAAHFGTWYPSGRPKRSRAGKNRKYE